MKEPLLRAFQFIEGGARYGAAVSVMNIAAGMRQADVDVEFGVFEGRPLAEPLRERGFSVHEIPARHRIDFRGIAALVRLLRTKRYDLVHTHLSRATVNGTIAARLTRTPIVATVHGMNRKYTYMLADHIMTVSDAAKQHLVKQGISASRITPVYNCIDLQPFSRMPSRTEAKKAFGFDCESLVIGTVSRAHHQKGVDLAIRTVEEVRRRGMDAKYLFIGDGPHLGEFKALAQQLGLSEDVRFPGYSREIVDALAAMDVFLFPTEREAFGISLLEAMAAEVPVVASAVDGVPEVLDNDSGILLDDRTPESFANAVQLLVTDSDRRSQIVENAKNRVATVFSVQSTASAVEQVYRLVLRGAELSSKRRRTSDVL